MRLVFIARVIQTVFKPYEAVLERFLVLTSDRSGEQSAARSMATAAASDAQ